jgi:hypothetical protein
MRSEWVSLGWGTGSEKDGQATLSFSKVWGEQSREKTARAKALRLEGLWFIQVAEKPVWPQDSEPGSEHRTW